jgi:UDP-N-acetyl-D-glucosamine/UDP-N-acetyl-D-galactosamine dehydrogenase
LARYFETWGLDINHARISELESGYDRTDEIDHERLTASTLRLTANTNDCPPADVYIVTVPTPIDDQNQPDLSPVINATKMVGMMIKAAQNPVIVYESTVYPGVTEEICGPLLEDVSGLKHHIDFALGYSPERINPGDREHTVDKIVKVIAGDSPAVTETLAAIYGKITSGGVFRAASIKAAEAAKVIENAQRDINIAFMNEVTQIFAKMDLSIWDVLAAANTKWNFLPFQPGLVGGHCIGVDPYYLSHRAQALGHDPQVILAGRAINDGMGKWIATQIHAQCGNVAGSVLMLGLTFKENVPDLRNSKVVDMIRHLEFLGHDITVHDPLADIDEAVREYGLTLSDEALERQYDIVVGAVAHEAYRTLDPFVYARAGGLVADLKRIWGGKGATDNKRLWSL